MSRFLKILTILVLLHQQMLAQCPTWSNAQDCSPLNALGGICNSSTIFCIGDSVGIENNTVTAVDSSFICWDDGTTQAFAGNFPGCIKHKYNYAIDSCVGGNGQIQKSIRLGIKTTCSTGESFHYISTPIDIKFRPKVSFQATPSIVCVGVPVVITNTSCANATNPTHFWDFGDGTNSSAGQPGTHTYNTPGTYTITYTITNSCGSATKSETVTVLPPTIINPLSGINDFCSPSAFVPDVNSQNVFSYLWTTLPPTGVSITLPTDSQPQFQINNSGNYTINLVVTGCCSSPTSDCQWDTSFTILQGPFINSTPIPTYCGSAVIAPSSYISSSGNITQYNWVFPGGTPSTSNAANPGNVSYSAPGNYPVTFIVNSNCGNDTLVDTVRVLAPTIIQPALTINNNCTPLAIAANMNAANALTYNWSISPSGTGTIVNPGAAQTLININNPGSITVQASTTGCCTAPQSVCNWDTTFTILQGPQISVSPIPSFCNSVNLNVGQYFSITGGVSTYQWDFPGGNPASSSLQNPGVISYTNSGNYQINLIVNGPCGTDTVSSTFTVSTPPAINIITSASYGCDTLTVNYNNIFAANGSYTWTANSATFTNGTNSNTASPSIFFPMPGFYTVDVTASTPGCPPVSSTFNVEIGKGPSITQIQQLEDICDTIALNLSTYFSLIPSTSDSGYSWNIYHNGSSIYTYAGSNPTIVPIQSLGTYIVEVAVWNACDSIVLRDTFNFSLPQTIILPNDTTVCKGSGSIILQATPPGGNWAVQGNLIGSSFNTDSTLSSQNILIYSYGTATCAVSDSLLITVVGAGINAGVDTFFCSNSSLTTFTGIPAGGLWSGYGITNPLNGTYDPSIPIVSIDTVVYIYSDSGSGFNCIIRDTLLVTIFQPTQGSSSFPDTACINAPVLFANNAPGTTSIWDVGDGSNLYYLNTFSHTYNSSGSYLVTLIYQNQFGCKDTSQSPIEIVAPPDALFSLDTNRGCSPLAINISNLSTYYGANTYFWDYGNGITDTVFNPGTTIFNQGPGDSTIYTIQLTSSNGCGAAVHTDSIIVYPIPVPEFGVTYNDSCSPALVFFNNITTGQPQYFEWYINGILVSTDSMLTPQVLVADTTDSTYVITLVSSNRCGVDSISKSVTIRPNQVTAFFNTDFIWGCKPLTCTFTSVVAANSIINWNFGDGNTAFGNTVTHTFDTAGIFIVWQYVDNLCGFDSISQTIEVLPQPFLDFTFNAKACDNELVQINNISPGISGYMWDFGDGSDIDTSNFSPSHVFTGPGNYTIMLIGYASGTGCPDTLYKTIQIVGHPDADLSISSSNGCVPFNINLISNTTGGIYYLWDLGNNDTLVGNPISYTYLNQGQYSITLTVVDSNLCQDDTVFNFINVFPVPEANFQYTQTPICETPTTITFANSSIGASSYEWNFGTLGQSLTQDPVLTVNTPTIINVSLIASNLYSCSDTLLYPLKVYGKPEASFNPLSTEGCIPLTITFNSTSINAGNAYWDLGNGTMVSGVSATTTYYQSGSYSITLIANEDSICFDTLSISNAVIAKSIPNADFTFSQVDTLVDPSGIYQFTNLSINAIRYEWDFGDGSGINTEKDPIHRFYNNGVYYVILYAFNQEDCPDTAVYPITVEFLGSLFIPNAFSPDAGTDETKYFIPKGVGLSEFNIDIFSPYGEKVWSSSMLSNGQPSEKWDGTFKERPLPQGAYVWKAHAVFQNGRIWDGMSYEGRKPIKTGSVMIIR
jgi:PKD repeat protein